MAISPVNLTTTTELAHQFQTKYNKDLLKRSIQLTVLDQFAAKMPFPKNAGAKTMRFFRQEAGASSSVNTLTEGTLLEASSTIGLDFVEATLIQYGERYNISDVMGMTELFSTLLGVKSRIAEVTALHADDIVRNMIAGAGLTGATPLTGFIRRYAQATATHAGLGAATVTAGALTITDLLSAMTQLQINRSPKKNGKYYAIVPPQVAFDLMLDPKFVQTGQYLDRSMIMKGEVGQWYGVSIVVATNPFREATNGSAEGTFNAAGGIFTTFVVGSDAFGTPIMVGQSEYSPKIMIIDSPDKFDALNQWTVVAWKSYWAAVTLNTVWGIAIKSKSTFV